MSLTKDFLRNRHLLKTGFRACFELAKPKFCVINIAFQRHWKANSIFVKDINDKYALISGG